jgi:hypothetical protein
MQCKGCEDEVVCPASRIAITFEQTKQAKVTYIITLTCSVSHGACGNHSCFAIQLHLNIGSSKDHIIRRIYLLVCFTVATEVRSLMHATRLMFASNQRHAGYTCQEKLLPSNHKLLDLQETAL